MSLSVKTQGGTGGMTASIFVTGLTETDTVTATKDGKTINGVWKAKAHPILPNEYTRLEYIESTGTQLIDTGFTPSSARSFKFSFDAAFLSASEASGTALYGDSRIYAGYYSGAVHFSLYKSGTAWSAKTYNADRHLFVLDGVNAIGKVDKDSISLNVGTQGTTGTLSLFGYSAAYLCSSRLWGSVIEENGEVVRNFIPARRNSDSVVGLYDLVNDVFYTNIGTGEFIAGAEAPQYEYISGHLISPIYDKGMWTVTATNGEDTVTRDVLVDGAFEYEIEMGYKLWLYREGDECEDVTGGWAIAGYTSGATKMNAGTKNADHIYLVGVDSQLRGLGIQNSVDVSKYSKLKVHCNAEANYQGGSAVWVHVVGSKDIANSALVPETTSSGLGVQTLEVDLSGVDSAAYIFVRTGGVNVYRASIYNVWLE